MNVLNNLYHKLNPYMIKKLRAKLIDCDKDHTAG